MSAGIFPEDSAERKEYPMFSGLLQYFPSALALVARNSYTGNQKHNPGLPLHHDRAKSDDEPDALVRHLVEGDYVGMAWRALSLLQKHCESHGAPIAPAARNASPIPNGSRIATAAEIEGLRDLLTAEELKGFGIGDVEPTTLPPLEWDELSEAIARTVARHPANAEALRMADERTPEDRL